MSYEVRFLPEAQKDFNQLDGSQKQQAAKAIQKVSQNPLPYTEGGYGKPLGNHRETILAGLLKIKLKKSGLRIVYKLFRQKEKMIIIVVGLRTDEAVYKAAHERLKNHSDITGSGE